MIPMINIITWNDMLIIIPRKRMPLTELIPLQINSWLERNGR